MNLSSSALLDLLTEEHKLISAAAKHSLLLAERQLNSPSSPTLDFALVLLQFFEQFSKAIHRAKEEELLFPWVAGSKDKNILEMIRVLQADHRFSSDILTKLSRSLPRELPPTIETSTVTALFARYGTYLLQHTAREEQMFYPAVRMQMNQLRPVSVSAAVVDQSLAAQRDWEKRLTTLGQQLSRHLT